MSIKRYENNHFYDVNKYGKHLYCLSDDELMNLPEKFRKIGSLSRLDRGSTCRVYRIDSEFPLVLKVINCGSDKNKYNNALYEKRIIDTLSQSDRVVPVLDFDVVESQNGETTVFILEKYLTPLEQVASINNLTKKELLKIAIDLCDAVREVISHGVFHLDIKPKNIFLSDENKVILGDLGSSLLEGDLAKNQSMRGTPEYMAPEVYQEHHCSECSEIYSIGLIVYYLLNERKLPFVEDVNDRKQRELATYKRLAGTELPVLSINSRVDDDINSLIKDACSYKSESRTKSISDLMSGLVNVLQQMDDFVEPDTNNVPAFKRILPIIFLIDTSGSMGGDRTATLNVTMQDALNILMEKSEEYVGSEIKVSVLKYSTSCEWVTKGLVSIADFQWKDLSTGGITNFGAAIRELNSKLSRTELFDSVSRCCVPIIINITDGIPTDDWEKEYDRINNNKWFRISRKICVTIGNDTDPDMLEKFCGTKETVVKAVNISIIKNLIADICVSASMLCSASVQPKHEWSETSMGYYDRKEYYRNADEGGYDAKGYYRSSRESDPIGTTTVLQSQCDANDDLEWDDGSWNVDSFATSVMLTPSEDDDASQRRRRLAEALRNGQELFIDSNGNTQINVSSSSGNNSDDFGGITVPSGKLAGGCRCRICDTPVFADTVFCPHCGTRITIEKPIVPLSKVEFSAVAPKQLVKGECSIVDVVMYEESCRHIVDEIRRQSDSKTQEKKSGKIKVQEEASIKVILSSKDIEVEDNEMIGVWQGSYLSFSFPVYLPENYKKKQVLFVAKIFVNNIIATKLTFVARCSSLFEQKINVSREDVLTAFISYASQDRKKVATIVQGMKKARPDMDLFFDVESLRSGDDWEKTLFREIEKRDVLYLCWSHYAKDSEWVDREWRYAYSQKGIDGIEPMPIELPEECPPPQELSGKHWNDKLLYLIGHLNKKSSETRPQSTTPEWDDSWT